MKFILVLYLAGVINIATVKALSEDDRSQVTEACCTYAEGLALNAESCSNLKLPDDIQPEEKEICLTAMRDCCNQQKLLNESCYSAMKLASSNQCSSAKSEAAKTCCEKCEDGHLFAELGGKESCQKPSADEINSFTALKEIITYQCCLKKAEMLETTTEKILPTTTKRVETTTEKIQTTTEKAKCKLDSCDQICDDEGGVVRCQCREGFRLQADKRTCKDINECAEAINDLCVAVDTVCHNTAGTFKCVPIQKREIGTCPPGFKRNVLNQVCDDINECQLPRPPCPKYLCENTIGGYKCAGKPGKPFEETVPGAITEAATVTTTAGPKTDICPPGFRAGEDECMDIDECLERLDDCQRLSQHCINTHGSFFCQDHVSRRCAPGFMANRATGICEDIDECEESSEVCKRNEVCINLPGAYNCKSKVSTLPKLAKKVCQEGTRIKPGGSICEDIDECREGTHLCDQFQNCINTYGAHECRCKNGFELDSSTGSCVDIDECVQKLDNCDSGLHCHNLVGSFTCLRHAPTTTTDRAPTTTPAPIYDYEYSDYEDENSTDVDDSKPIPNTPITTSSTTTEATTISTKLKPSYPYNKPRYNTSRPTYNEPIPTPKPLPPRPDESPREENQRRPEDPRRTDSRTPESRRESRVGSDAYTPKTTQTRPEITSPTPVMSPSSPEPAPPQPEPTLPKLDPTRVDPPTPRAYPTQPKPETTSAISVTTPRRLYYPHRPDPNSEGSNRIPDYRRPDYPRRPETTSERPEVTISTVSSTTEAIDNAIDEILNSDDKHCLSGFEKDPDGNCIDIDECQNSQHICTNMELCSNRKGGYTCICIPGFEREPSGWCVPTSTSTSSTSTTSTTTSTTTTTTTPRPSPVPTPPAVFTPNRRSKSCELGYTYDFKLDRCVDIDECKLNTATCSSNEECLNIGGGYQCICGEKCKEAREKPSYSPPPKPAQAQPTPALTTNVITVGAQYGQRGPWSLRPSRSRLPYSGAVTTSCPWGYRLTNLDNRCVDIDECAHNVSECGPQQRCENFYGGYSCQCPTGHRLVGQNACEDIDECNHGSPCSYNSKCINTVGSYRCECGPGFRSAPTNDKVCVDIDECQSSVCQHSCANTWGSYRCFCRRGYRLQADNKTCSDVDECAEWSAVRQRGKLCAGECVNVPGSYRCRCPAGYRLSEDATSCIDIDECETGEATCARAPNPGEVCQNTRGGYHCYQIDCPDGYRLEAKHRCTRIQRLCPMDDWGCLQLPTTYSYNFITFVANILLPSGSVDLFTMHGPAWREAVVSFELRMTRVRAAPHVRPAHLRCFDMRPSGNICVISLLCSLEGPQVIELELTMSLYQRGMFAGSAVARLIIIVSQYDY